MKMSWGNGLVVVFIGFVALIGTLVYKSMNTKFDLVSKDYYKDELRYQDKIDGKKNAAQLSEITISQTEKELQIQMPQELKNDVLTGDIWLYCKTDAVRDVKVPLSTTNNIALIAKDSIIPGSYTAKITWKAADKSYYAEKEFTVN